MRTAIKKKPLNNKVQQTTTKTVRAGDPSAFVQLKLNETCSCDGGCPRCSGDNLIQTKSFENNIRSLRGGGQPLPRSTREFFEPRFHRDFSNVRVHTGPGAEEAAKSVNARAFTLGKDIVFRDNQPSFDTQSGKHLLAHELTHTIQQGVTSRTTGITNGIIMRKWDNPNGNCNDIPKQKKINKIVIEQETPQRLTIHWNDGTMESDTCSTGKGHCCIDPKNPGWTACSVTGSRVSGSNCTPITSRKGHKIRNRYLNYNGWDFWSDFVTSRGIGMHQYPTVDGTPLSHGCVRLHKNTARKIFCGAQRNTTWVQVLGFPRPMCNHPQLIKEWTDDFSTAASSLKQFASDKEYQKTIRVTRTMLRKAFGRKLTVAQMGKLTAKDIPKCGPKSTAAAKVTVPERILGVSGFNRFFKPFKKDITRAYNFSRARKVVGVHGQKIWNAAVKRAQVYKRTDDRPLYWARSNMLKTIRQWKPRFSLSQKRRQLLITIFTESSRGMTTVSYKKGSGMIKILISGFDPFGFGGGKRAANPSGSAVLALDGKSIAGNVLSGEVQGVIFPVNFSQFDAGMVEKFFKPYFTGHDGIDIIMTLGMGGSALFEVEEYAAPPRASARYPYSGKGGTGAFKSPRKFYKTTLPTRTIRGALGRTSPRKEETQVEEIPKGATKPVQRPKGPTSGSTPVKGPAGTFLCNEIFYRTSLLKERTKSNVPAGFIHTPLLKLPLDKNLIRSQSFEKNRDDMIKTIEKIMKAVLDKHFSKGDFPPPPKGVGYG